MHPASAGVALFVDVDEMFYLYVGAAVVGVVHTPHHPQYGIIRRRIEPMYDRLGLGFRLNS